VTYAAHDMLYSFTKDMELVQKFIEFFFRKKWLGVLLILGLAWGIGISTFYRGAISPKQRTDRRYS